MMFGEKKVLLVNLLSYEGLSRFLGGHLDFFLFGDVSTIGDVYWGECFFFFGGSAFETNDTFSSK